MRALDEIRWGMIGCGSVTEVKSGPAFSRVPFSTLHAVSGRRPDRIADYAARHGVPHWYEHPEDLVRDPLVNAIYVATPPSSHCEYALLAAAHGKPVYVEKPLALTAAQGATMHEACLKAGVPLFVAYYRRRLPRFLKIADLLHKEAIIGTVRFVRTCLFRSLEPRYQNPAELPWNVQPAISGGGLFVDLGSHTLDILDFLFGPIKEVSGYAISQQHAYPAEDAVSASWVFENGILGSGIWNFVAHGRTDEVQIVGDKGTMTFATFGDDPISVLSHDGELTHISIRNPFHLQEPLITSVVEQLRGIGTCPSTGESALRTQRVLDAVLHISN